MAEPNLQTDVVTSYRVQSAPGAIATNDSTARVFPMTAGDGLSLTKRPLPSQRIRSDLQTTRPRMGSRAVAGTMSSTLAVATFDPILEAAFRATFAAALTLSPVTLTAYDAANGLLSRSAGSWLTDGIRVGDTITGDSAFGANANVPLVVAAVTASTLTIGNRTDIGSFASFAGVVFKRGKKLAMGGTPVPRLFTIEHWQPGITLSERFIDCKLASITIAMPAEGIVGLTTTWIGKDMQPIASTRYFALATDVPGGELAVADTVTVFRGAQALNVRDLSLSWDCGVTAPVGVGSRTAYRVSDGNTDVSGAISLWRDSTANLAAFLDETGPYSFQVMFREAATNNYITFCLPNVTLGAATATERVGASGFQVETIPLLVGIGVAPESDASMITCTTSAA